MCFFGGACDVWQKFHLARGGISHNTTTSVTRPAHNSDISMIGLPRATFSTPINQSTNTPSDNKELINSAIIVARKPTISSADDLPKNASARREGGVQRLNAANTQILFDTLLIN